MISYIFIVATFLASTLHAHSWVECTKYNGDPADFSWDDCDSNGKPRPLSDGRNVGAAFGQDIGMDYRPGNNNQPCQGNSDRFGANYPNGVVEYVAGETFTLAWPAKNHVAAECTNPNIPDTFLKLFMTPYTENQQDPDQDVFRQGPVPASFSDDPHVRNTIDFKGFQNCPDFCGSAGTDRATCTGTFTVPTNTDPGLYTLQWYWAFNGPQDLYSTCWEARVIAPEVSSPQGGGTSDDSDDSGATTNLDVADPDSRGLPIVPIVVVSIFFVAIGIFTLYFSDTLSLLMSKMCNKPEKQSDPEMTMKGIDSQPRSHTGVEISRKNFPPAGTKTVSAMKARFEKEKPLPKGRKGRIDSVITKSGTTLPTLPTPQLVDWWYINPNDETIGPIQESALAAWVQSIGSREAGNCFVWNGASVGDWTLLSDLPALLNRLSAQK